MRDQYAMKYDGKKWIMIAKDELINTVYEDKKEYIEDNLEDFAHALKPSAKRALDTWLQMENNDPHIKKVKKDIKLLFYNNKDMVCDNIQTPHLNKVQNIHNPKAKVRKTIKDIIIESDESVYSDDSAELSIDVEESLN